jgi:SAM-dependent methyltransferase
MDRGYMIRSKAVTDKYVDVNSGIFDRWVEEGWQWGQPISHQVFERAKAGDWSVVLTPNKPVPREWFGELRGARVLGLASGGGQQMPIFAALGAKCTVLDYSERQLASEREVAAREGYEIEIIRADMSQPLPLPDASFDLIFHPVANSYIEEVLPLWRECYRILKPGGILLAGLDNSIMYLFDDDELNIIHPLPFNPLKDEQLYAESLANDWGIQFSHSIEEQVGGQLKAGFILTDIFHDTNGEGRLRNFNVPTFYVTRSVKP